jgi:hypothetical protein
MGAIIIYRYSISTILLSVRKKLQVECSQAWLSKKNQGLQKSYFLLPYIICYKKSTLKQFIVTCFKRLILNNKEFILKEILEVKGLMHLFMKYKNTGKNGPRKRRRRLKCILNKYLRLFQ